MPKKTSIRLFSLLFILYSNVLTGQEEKTSYYPESFINLNLLSPTFSFVPRWNLGYYRSVNEHFIIGLDAAYGSKDITINDLGGYRFTEDYQVWEVRPEIKYMFGSDEDAKSFLSAEVFYIHHTDQFSGRTIYSRPDGSYFKFKSADYQRQKYGFNIFFGKLLSINKKFGMIIKSGVGLKVRNVNFSNFNGLEPTFKPEDAGFFSAIIPNSDDYLDVLGKDLGLNIAFDVSFFIRLD